MTGDIIELRRRVILDLNDLSLEFGGYKLGKTSGLYRVASEFSSGLENKEKFRLLSSALVFYNSEKLDILESDFNYSPKDIEAIKAIVESGVYSQSPLNGTEKLFCDAVASEFAKDDYLMFNGLRRKMFANDGIEFSNVQWFGFLRNIFLDHNYFTKLGKSRFEEDKKTNLAKIVVRLRQEELKSLNK